MGRKTDAILKGFRAAKCLTLLKLTTSRIKVVRNKRTVAAAQLRKEIAHLIQSGNDAHVYITKADVLIKEQNLIAAYDLIEQFCHSIISRFAIIETQKNVPLDLKEPIASLIYATPRCTDLTELVGIKDMFTGKYGKDFAIAAAELRPDCGVHRELIEKLTTRPATGQMKLKLMREICMENKIDWKPTDAFGEPTKDSLDGPKQTISGRPPAANEGSNIQLQGGQVNISSINEPGPSKVNVEAQSQINSKYKVDSYFKASANWKPEDGDSNSSDTKTSIAASHSGSSSATKTTIAASHSGSSSATKTTIAASHSSSSSSTKTSNAASHSGSSSASKTSFATSHSENESRTKGDQEKGSECASQPMVNIEEDAVDSCSDSYVSVEEEISEDESTVSKTEIPQSKVSFKSNVNQGGFSEVERSEKSMSGKLYDKTSSSKKQEPQKKSIKENEGDNLQIKNLSVKSSFQGSKVVAEEEHVIPSNRDNQSHNYLPKGKPMITSNRDNQSQKAKSSQEGELSSESFRVEGEDTSYVAIKETQKRTSSTGMQQICVGSSSDASCKDVKEHGTVIDDASNTPLQVKMDSCGLQGRAQEEVTSSNLIPNIPDDFDSTAKAIAAQAARLALLEYAKKNGISDPISVDLNEVTNSLLVAKGNIKVKTSEILEHEGNLTSSLNKEHGVKDDKSKFSFGKEDSQVGKSTNSSEFDVGDDYEWEVKHLSQGNEDDKNNLSVGYKNSVGGNSEKLSKLDGGDDYIWEVKHESHRASEEDCNPFASETVVPSAEEMGLNRANDSVDWEMSQAGLVSAIKPEDDYLNSIFERRSKWMPNEKPTFDEDLHSFTKLMPKFHDTVSGYASFGHDVLGQVHQRPVFDDVADVFSKEGSTPQELVLDTGSQSSQHPMFDDIPDEESIFSQGASKSINSRVLDTDNDSSENPMYDDEPELYETSLPVNESLNYISNSEPEDQSSLKVKMLPKDKLRAEFAEDHPHSTVNTNFDATSEDETPKSNWITREQIDQPRWNSERTNKSQSESKYYDGRTIRDGETKVDISTKVMSRRSTKNIHTQSIEDIETELIAENNPVISKRTHSTKAGRVDEYAAESRYRKRHESKTSDRVEEQEAGTDPYSETKSHVYGGRSSISSMSSYRKSYETVVDGDDNYEDLFENKSNHPSSRHTISNQTQMKNAEEHGNDNEENRESNSWFTRQSVASLPMEHKPDSSEDMSSHFSKQVANRRHKEIQVAKHEDSAITPPSDVRGEIRSRRTKRSSNNKAIGHNKSDEACLYEHSDADFSAMSTGIISQRTRLSQTQGISYDEINDYADGKDSDARDCNPTELVHQISIDDELEGKHKRQLEKQFVSAKPQMSVSTPATLAAGIAKNKNPRVSIQYQTLESEENSDDALNGGSSRKPVGVSGRRSQEPSKKQPIGKNELENADSLEQYIGEINLQKPVSAHKSSVSSNALPGKKEQKWQHHQQPEPRDDNVSRMEVLGQTKPQNKYGFEEEIVSEYDVSDTRSQRKKPSGYKPVVKNDNSVRTPAPSEAYSRDDYASRMQLSGTKPPQQYGFEEEEVDDSRSQRKKSSGHRPIVKNDDSVKNPAPSEASSRDDYASRMQLSGTKPPQHYSVEEEYVGDTRSQRKKSSGHRSIVNNDESVKNPAPSVASSLQHDSSISDPIILATIPPPSRKPLTPTPGATTKLSTATSAPSSSISVSADSIRPTSSKSPASLKPATATSAPIAPDVPISSALSSSSTPTTKKAPQFPDVEALGANFEAFRRARLGLGPGQ